MTDAQIFTMAVAIIAPLCAVIYSNSRVGDIKDLIRSEIEGVRKDIKSGFENMDAKLKIHELEHHK